MSMAGIVVGLVVMLAGVFQTAGQSVNALVAAGGAIVLLAMGVLTLGVMRLDGGHAAE